MTVPKTVLSIFPGFAVGGQQARFAALANHFGQAWRHVIVSLNGDMTCRERLDPGLTAECVAFTAQGSLPTRLRQIRSYIASIRPDVVVTHNWGSIEWAMANAVLPLARHIHIEDGFGPEERDHQIPRRVWTRRVVLRRAEVVLPSQTLLCLARNVWHLPENRLHYVPNGIDLQRFAPHPTALRAELVIGSIAALRPEKNIARLLRAFRLVLDQTPARLVIVGDGPEAASLRALAAELGIAQAVDFTGHQPNPAAALAGFDIFALSSDTEQMPISLLEAMATGLAVAATDVGDVRAMLAPDNRRFVVDRSTVALATALLALATDSTARHHLGAANRVEVAARFDQTTMFATYNALLFPQFTG